MTRLDELLSMTFEGLSVWMYNEQLAKAKEIAVTDAKVDSKGKWFDAQGNYENSIIKSSRTADRRRS